LADIPQMAAKFGALGMKFPHILKPKWANVTGVLMRLTKGIGSMSAFAITCPKADWQETIPMPSSRAPGLTTA